MKNVSEVYTADFFRDYVDRGPGPEPHRQVARAILAVAEPGSVTDVGCGPGVMIHELYKHGVSVVGIEGSRAAFDAAGPIRRFMYQHDLRTWTPGMWPPAADVVSCTEVAEHLEGEYADKLVETVVRLAKDRIFFTGATPKQGGFEHVNEQPREYWLEKFSARGFDSDPETTLRFLADGSMQEARKALPWIFDNAQWLRRRSA